MLDRKTWINFLALLPSTLVTVLAIGVAFLRFYDQTDFEFLNWVAHPRIWSNRLTVAAIVAALANFGVEWNRRNREAVSLAEDEARRVAQERAEASRRAADEARRVAQERAEANRRAEKKQQAAEERERAAEERERAAEERERTARRARIEARCRAAQIRFQLEPSEGNRQGLINNLAVLNMGKLCRD